MRTSRISNSSPEKKTSGLRCLRIYVRAARSKVSLSICPHSKSKPSCKTELTLENQPVSTKLFTNEYLSSVREIDNLTAMDATQLNQAIFGVALNLIKLKAAYTSCAGVYPS
jgi:hypothetical protein